MKHPLLVVLCSLMSLVPLQAEDVKPSKKSSAKQSEASARKKSKDAKATKDPKNKPAAPDQSFLQLPEESRNAFAALVTAARNDFRDRKLPDALLNLEKADAIYKNSVDVLMLRGSCYVELRIFDKAAESFRAADKILPGNPSIRFNLAEVSFVTHQWKDAKSRFQEVLTRLPDGNLAMRRLVEFKIFLCTSRTGPDKEADALAAKYDEKDSSPYAYFVKAARSGMAGDPKAAKDWIAMAHGAFPEKNALDSWQDTIDEFGISLK